MFTLENVVPWGRSFQEYQRMFALDVPDLSGRVLGCADGPASFNAAATGLGFRRVVSCDPLYRASPPEIRERIAATSERILEETRANQHEFVWDTIRSVEELGEIRHEAMALFLDDYEEGRREGRYVAAELPTLPFADGAFDLALCSHFLFLYSEALGEAFHLAAFAELCRVAREVRVFPLLALGAVPSPHVAPVMSALTAAGWDASIEPVAYEFQKGGNRMLHAARGRPSST